MNAPPSTRAGCLIDLLGPVVRARLEGRLTLGEIVFVGDEHLLAEVVSLEGETATLQVYESTVGLAAGAPVYATGHPLEVELGPGLLGSIVDGLQRRLPALAASDGDFLLCGRHPPALDRGTRWRFEPAVSPGDALEPGALVGRVSVGPGLEHRVLVPPGIRGGVITVADAGEYTVDATIALLASAGAEIPLTLMERWPARRPRPYARRLPLTVPLVTGQRVLDTFFPVPCGGTVGMPGGFGTGKTVMQQQLCKWARADVIVFVGCGERGNEMADVLSVLPTLDDPRTGHPLSERTVLVANTSDMPVAAREASIYVAVTIAEYYRDMGYDALLLADSTSRWAEALREISGRLGEMPAEEGYPPYLASRIAAFYERAGRVTTLSGAEGSVTLVGAVSPPGGDLTEPVTRHTSRHTRCFWTMDRAMAQSRRFPAISLVDSYSDCADGFGAWWQREVHADWAAMRLEALALLDDAERLEATARLVGTSSLPPRQQLLLAFGQLFQDAFLVQSARERVDEWCSPTRQSRMLELLLHVVREGCAAADTGAAAADVLALPAVAELRRARTTIGEAEIDRLRDLRDRFDRECAALRPAAGAAV